MSRRKCCTRMIITMHSCTFRNGNASYVVVAMTSDRVRVRTPLFILRTRYSDTKLSAATCEWCLLLGCSCRVLREIFRIDCVTSSKSRGKCIIEFTSSSSHPSLESLLDVMWCDARWTHVSASRSLHCKHKNSCRWQKMCIFTAAAGEREQNCFQSRVHTGRRRRIVCRQDARRSIARWTSDAEQFLSRDAKASAVNQVNVCEASRWASCV